LVALALDTERNSEPMYKKRFALWNSRKNYTKDQKEEALRHLQMDESEDPLASITINKKPLKSNRLRRPVQQNGRQVLLAYQNLHRRGQANSNMSAKSSAARSRYPPGMMAVMELDSSPGLLPRIQLQQSPESQRIEQILRLAQIYWSSYAIRPANLRDYGFGQELADVFNYLFNARRFLEQNDSRAFVMLNKACFGTRALFIVQPFRLFEYIILEFSNPQWSKNWQIKLALLRYLNLMAQYFLGQEHPISKTAVYLAAEGDTTELTSKFSRLCIDTVNSTLADSHYDTVAEIQFSVLCFLEQSGNLDDMDKLCQQIVLKPEQKYARTYIATRQAFRDLDWKGAERILLEAAEDVTQATGLPNGDWAGNDVCSGLGTVYRHLGNAAESAKYFRLAIEGGLRLWGEENTNVLDDVRRLEVVLAEFGEEEQLKQLRERWKSVWDRLEIELKDCSPVASLSL
jgi:hypothetical protein